MPNEPMPIFVLPDPDVEAARAAQVLQQEEADVTAWLKKITDARDFDANARKQYAIDRSYCRNSAGRGTFDVRVPIAATYVDLLVAFLYSRDPQADVQPSEACGNSRTEMARQLGKTMEIVVARLWKNGKLKPAVRRAVRSGLTIGIGWWKATWQERTGQDPIVAQRIADLQDNLGRLTAHQQQLAAGEAADPDAMRATIEQELAGLEAKLEVIVQRGMAIDFIAGEDIQVATDVPALLCYADAPWIAHRTFMPLSDAKAKYPRIADVIGSAANYVQVKPADTNESAEPGPISNARAEDADSFRAAGDSSGAGQSCVCVWEVWNLESTTVITVIEGLKRYAVEPYQPKPATTRFYPFFQWAPIDVDGDRHPQSLPSRSVELLDEYNRTRSNFREHRRRALPKLGFDSSRVEVEDAKRMEAGAAGEMIGINMAGEGGAGVLFPIAYATIDQALYDTSVIRAELELVWGIQEALSSSIRTAKTLGEAEIQQSGTEARNGTKRDSLEEALTEFATFTAEIALGVLSGDDVRTWAGAEAFWPASEEGRLGIEDLSTLVNVEIRAGSSGKPNTTAQREQWVALLDPLERGIAQIAQLRNSDPLKVADCAEQLLRETIERFGDRSDPARFIPTPGQPIQLIDPATGQPVLAFPAPVQPGAPAPMPPQEM